MTRVRHSAWLMLVSLSALTGCGIAGDWKVIEVKPEGSVFPMSSVTFGEDGSYSATSTYGGKAATSSGTYEWNGMKLTVKPKEGPTRTYSGTLGMDNKLVLKHKSDKGEMTGVMEKQKK